MRPRPRPRLPAKGNLAVELPLEVGNGAGVTTTVTDPFRIAGLPWYLMFSLVLAGCEREEIAVYEIPKETPTAERAASGAAEPAAAAALPEWEPGARWTPVTPSAMLLAKFTISGEDGGAEGAGTASESAEVTVSAFPGDVGGLLRNVNRWRGQLGLEPVDEASLDAMLSELEQDGEPGSLIAIDGTNPQTATPSKIVVYMTSREGKTWFYKLTGDSAVVERESEAFAKFVQSVKYPR